MSSHTSLSDLCNYSGFIINISKQLAVETKNLAAPQKLPSRISAPVWVRVIIELALELLGKTRPIDTGVTSSVYYTQQ